MTFGEKLKELRVDAGMTQAGLSEASDVPLGTIRDYEQGKRDPLLSSAQRLARALHHSLDVFPQPTKRRRGATTASARQTARGKRSRKTAANGTARKPTRTGK